jgi:hypothetical protein
MNIEPIKRRLPPRPLWRLVRYDYYKPEHLWSIKPKRATTDPGNQCGPGKQTRSESHLPLLLQRSSAPVRLLTLDQARVRVDGRAVRLNTIKEVLESILRDVRRRDHDVLVRRMVTAQ